jgi:D-alanyl-D-alanine carboxypeptidase
VKTGSLVLSDDTHSYSLSDTDASLAKIYDYRASNHTGTMPYQLAGMSQYMNQEALAAMDAFLTDCAAATGTNSVILRMAFLTTAEQTTYQSSLRDHAKDYLTGYGCDLRISGGDGASYALTTNEAVNAWLNDNAAKYGFVVRYPADKADVTGVAEYTNYFRYVGVAHATYMKENNLCLEEYIQLLTQYSSTNRLSVTTSTGKVYEIYYCAVNGNTSISCPTNYAYTISGTNAGGVVVTVDRSSVLVSQPEESGTDASTDTSVESTADTAT